ncbi:MotA/TolQ/ExbB proton channel family protein [Phaeobacter inhibens]|uniref:MotA/TolQ/ExbB proton channel family protein n=1 Tax=Phaeobacter inhibens TaxID=221822 RepID=UPI0021A3FC29|nr:MotA/TolQ/ExbB proton channel family protein [Phaeobacter inhibens]UWR60189.1 MotA/TolQ/ExbB proton channel family protein [Phaeobacter inhibens]
MENGNGETAARTLALVVSDRARTLAQWAKSGLTHAYGGFVTWFGRQFLGPDLSLRSAGWLLVLPAALLLAFFTYLLLQLSFQAQLRSVAERADILAAACASIPSVDQSECVLGEDDKRARPNGDLIWNILLDAAVINTDTVSSPAELEAAAQDDPALDNTLAFFGKPERQTESGIGFLIALSRAICRDASTNDVGYPEAIAYHIAGLYPRAWERPNLEADAARSLRFRFTQPSSITDAEIVEALVLKSRSSLGHGYQIDTAALSNCNLKFGTSNVEEVDPIDLWNAHDQLEQLMIWGIGQIRTTSEYRSAVFKLTLVTGPEQFLIFFVGYLAFLLTLIRLWAGGRMITLSRRIVDSNARTDRIEDDVLGLLTSVAKAVRDQSPNAKSYWKEQVLERVASARWPVRLAVSILPAIGFIGTVRGIMNSLTGADSIVWATTSAERAQAISGLSADLGLAFATTMLALSFGIVLSVIAALELRFLERAMLPLFGAELTEEPPDDREPAA